MKKLLSLLLSAAMILSLTACEMPGASGKPVGTFIELSDNQIVVHDREDSLEVELPNEFEQPVYFGDAVRIDNDIVYYEEGKDFTYGEGEKGDSHSADEANAHTVVTITQPGEYFLRGKLSAGQIAVDLGEDAKNDPEAVVTLLLCGLDLTCTVAPAIIFYNVYECGDRDNPTMNVDTSAAGANILIGSDCENVVNGSYVARIYNPDSVVLSADGTEVEEAKKLHKYDAAVYSRMSMNVDGTDGGAKEGILRIDAENEGLDSELHLTINGGTIFIESGNDGINTNEDGVSVTTVNGGTLTIMVTGETGEGDGIDSNGWLVLNGGTVAASACNNSMDAGIDSDMGIHIGEGATVMAFGHMLDRIEGAEQNYAVFQFGGTQSGEEEIVLKNADGAGIMADALISDYSVLIYSAPILTAGEYTLWSGDTQLGHSGVQGGNMGRPGGMKPGEMPEPPEGFDPESMPVKPADMPEGMAPPQGGMGGGRGPGGMGGFGGGQKATEKTFTIEAKETYFNGVGVLAAEE